MRKYKKKHISLLKAEYDRYIKAMIRADFNKTEAAKLLHITRKTLYNKFQKFKEAGIHVPTEPIQS